MQELMAVYVIEVRVKGTICVDCLEAWTDLDSVKSRIGYLNCVKTDPTITYCYKPIYVYEGKK